MYCKNCSNGKKKVEMVLLAKSYRFDKYIYECPKCGFIEKLNVSVSVRGIACDSNTHRL